MNNNYEGWIADRLSRENPLGKCKEWVNEMAIAFPELQKIRGHVMLSIGIERAHWWLVDSGGNVIDPTVQQFTDPNGLFNSAVAYYEPWKEGTAEPTGKCPNCGDFCYTGDTCCSDECRRSYVAYCLKPTRI